MQQQPIAIQGTVTRIGDLERIQRSTKPDLHKRVLTFVSEDGQMLFPEIRNRKLDLLQGIKEGDKVVLNFIFQGSEKNGKRYNNVYACDIAKL